MGSTEGSSQPSKTQPPEQARAEYEKATQGLLFTKDFQSRQEALMRDPLATVGERVMACILRRSWGEYSLYAIKNDGEPLLQKDICDLLGVNKTRVSHTIAYYEERGYLVKKRKWLYPVISPVLLSTEKVADIRNLFTKFSSFLLHWKVAHSTEFEELEVARSTVKRITKVALSDYRKVRRVEKNGGASLYETEEDILETNPPTDRPVLVSAPPEPDPEPEKPVGRSDEGLNINGSAKAQLEKHLQKFDVPSPLTPETIAAVAEHLPTQELVDQFIEATAGDKPRSWGFFIKKAPKIAEDHPRYMAAKAAAGNGSPPGKTLTREEQKVEAWLRRREEQGK